jgi:hypothetical protein
METLQNLLTIAAEATVIVGLAGIFAHALYTQHKSFMTEFCPPIAPYQAEVKVEEAIAVDEVEQPAIQPEVQVDEVEKTVTPLALEQPEIDLTSLDPTALRKLCTRYEIVWRSVEVTAE